MTKPRGFFQPHWSMSWTELQVLCPTCLVSQHMEGGSGATFPLSLPSQLQCPTEHFTDVLCCSCCYLSTCSDMKIVYLDCRKVSGCCLSLVPFYHILNGICKKENILLDVFQFQGDKLRERLNSVLLQTKTLALDWEHPYCRAPLLTREAHSSATHKALGTKSPTGELESATARLKLPPVPVKQEVTPAARAGKGGCRWRVTEGVCSWGY